MPFNVVGFYEATPGTGTVNIAAVADDLYRTSGDQLFLNAKTPYVLGVLYTAVSTPAAAILRQAGVTDKYLNRGALCTGTDPATAFSDLMGRPIPLVVAEGEKLEALSLNATDEKNLIALLLGSGKITQAAKDNVIVTDVVRGTIDQAATAGAWTDGTVTWTPTLKAGKYSIVGMRAGHYKAANPHLGVVRLVIPGGVGWRPGVPSINLGGDKTIPNTQTFAPWNHWGQMEGVEIDTVVGMPNVELLYTDANTDYTVELQLMKKS